MNEIPLWAYLLSPPNIHKNSHLRKVRYCNLSLVEIYVSIREIIYNNFRIENKMFFLIHLQVFTGKIIFLSYYFLWMQILKKCHTRCIQRCRLIMTPFEVTLLECHSFLLTFGGRWEMREISVDFFFFTLYFWNVNERTFIFGFLKSIKMNLIVSN